jgi:hypothetical protein
MKKIAALIDKLQELKEDEAALNEMAYYTQLLYAELMCTKNASETQYPAARRKVAVIMPTAASAVVTLKNAEPVKNAVPFENKEKEPVVHPEVALVQEEEVFLTERQVNGNGFQPVTAKRTAYAEAEINDRYHDVGWETMTKKEINEVIVENRPSLNDQLKRESRELGTKLTDGLPVKDLCKAIGINDKFLFINELFRGDGNMFDRSVRTINECGSLAEAEYWMGRELRIKLGWQEKKEAVQQFYYLVKKRFS